MRISTAVIMTIVLAGLTACGSAYGPSGPGGGGGGPVGSVTVGPGVAFVSGHNGTLNPAVDTIAAGATVTWTWTGNDAHSVQSIGAPSFTSSNTKTGRGTYALRFDVPGTYRYDCIVHGQAMTGTIVVTVAPPAEAAAAMLGFVDFDVDRDSATGLVSAVDEFRLDGGATGLGVDYQLHRGARRRADGLRPQS